MVLANAIAAAVRERWTRPRSEGSVRRCETLILVDAGTSAVPVNATLAELRFFFDVTLGQPASDASVIVVFALMPNRHDGNLYFAQDAEERNVARLAEGDH